MNKNKGFHRRLTHVTGLVCLQSSSPLTRKHEELILKRPKPTIKAIVYSEDKLKFIGQNYQNLLCRNIKKREYVRRFVGAQCGICHELPTK